MTILKLETPLEFGKELITELHFQEPKAKHMLELKENMTFSDVLRISSLLTNQPLKSVIYNLSVKDARRVVEKTSFLLAGE
jgi:hypothetical protein